MSAWGRFALFLIELTRELLPGLRYGRLIMAQARFIGVGSLPLVFLTSLFVGGVSALQSAYQFQGAVPLVFVGTFIAKSVFIELGPVLTALVVGARVGSSFAAEIGTMRVTEQVDALETLAIRPVRFLAVPRLVAAFFMLPVVTVFANIRKSYISLQGVKNKDALLATVLATLLERYANPSLLAGVHSFFKDEGDAGRALQAGRARRSRYSGGSVLSRMSRSSWTTSFGWTTTSARNSTGPDGPMPLTPLTFAPFTRTSWIAVS